MERVKKIEQLKCKEFVVEKSARPTCSEWEGGVFLEVEEIYGC
jgi:hypothetical protein